HVLDESGLDIDGDGYIDPDGLGDEIVSATTEVIPKELTHDNENQAYHDTIKTKQGAFYATFLCPVPGQPPHWILCFLVCEQDLIAPAKNRLLVHLGITGGTIIVSLFLTTWIGFAIAKPIEDLSRTARNLGQLKLVREPMTKSLIHEVDELGNAIRSMHTGISSFLRYVPQDLLRRYMSSGQTATIDSELTEVTILFADVKDFTSLSEQIEPMILVRQLNEFLETISVCVLEHNGTVDKYIGDAVMAFWNAPIRVPGHAREASSCVLEFSPRMAILQNKWISEGLTPMQIRVGLHTGEAIVGNLGSSVRLNYTIINDAVNLASRLEGLNKAYSTSNLISETTRSMAGFEFLTRPVDIVAVKGKNAPIQVHELMNWAKKATEEEQELARQTSHAWDLYKNQTFKEAEAAYSNILKHYPHDGLAKTMLERCKDLLASPPSAPWSGVYRSRNK
ncbi:MAG: adenylate/guanylate cyclase domain-containing protein, partial [Planctomycetes bacterium]|nr:adenylate/guanylate cyclase domain-containing protein [Planctomycetota bacterium]